MDEELKFELRNLAVYELSQSRARDARADCPSFDGFLHGFQLAWILYMVWSGKMAHHDQDMNKTSQAINEVGIAVFFAAAALAALCLMVAHALWRSRPKFWLACCS